MTQKFKKAFNKTMGIEGSYANDPQDRGGETYKGIARKRHPNWHGWVIIDQIKKEVGVLPSQINKKAKSHSILQNLVLLFYKENFWNVNKLDEVPDKIAEELFDTGVNMGTSIASFFLQEALNLCNDNQRLYPNITMDGKIGPITLSTLKRSNQTRVLKTLNLLQGERYLQILRNNESQEKFWGGWLNRVIC